MILRYAQEAPLPTLRADLGLGPDRLSAPKLAVGHRGADRPIEALIEQATARIALCGVEIAELDCIVAAQRFTCIIWDRLQRIS